MSEQPPISTPPHPYPGKLIIVEGIDGSGKSTQLLLLHKWLESKGHKVFFTEWNSADLSKRYTGPHTLVRKTDDIRGRLFQLSVDGEHRDAVYLESDSVKRSGDRRNGCHGLGTP